VESQGSSSNQRWLRDLARFLPLKSQFVLSGNIRDLHTQEFGGVVTAASLTSVLLGELARAGYEEVVYYDPVTGFRVLDRPDGAGSDATALLGRLGLTSADGVAPAGTDLFAVTLERLVHLDGPPIALIADFASRFVVRSDALSPTEHQLFTRALVSSQTASARPVGPNRTPLFNAVLWIVDKEGDLPDWLTIDNPYLRHVPISNPDRATRRALAPSLVRSLPGARAASREILCDAEDDLVDSTEGLLLVDLSAIAQLARSESVNVEHIGDAVRRYKVGVTEDAWLKIERERIRGGADFVSRRVIGQDHAITHMLDIVKRAATGAALAGPRGGVTGGLKARLSGEVRIGRTTGT